MEWECTLVQYLCEAPTSFTLVDLSQLPKKIINLDSSIESRMMIVFLQPI